jgi:hypothetical protein
MSNTTNMKRRGRPATGKGESINVRLQPDQLAALDAWIVQQAVPPSRPEAIRHALAEFLSGADAVDRQ